MKRSLARRLVVGFSCVVGLSLLLVLGLLAAYQTRASHVALATDLGSTPAALARMIEPALWDVDLDRASQVAAAFARDPRVARVVLREPTTGVVRSFERVATADTATRVVAIARGGQVLGQLTVSLDRGYYRRRVTEQVAIALLVTLVALAVSLAGLRLLFRRLLRQPLDELAAMARGYAGGAAPAGANAIRYVEFRELGELLEAMSTQIRQQVAELSAANRELGALNRFLVFASAERDASELMAEATHVLGEVFGTIAVRAELRDEEDDAPALVLSTDPEPWTARRLATLSVPILVGGECVGTIALARAGDRPFTAAELALASALGAQVSAGVERLRANETERLLRAAVAQLPESVIVTDARGEIVFVNPAYTTTTGYAAAEVLGMRAPQLAPLLGTEAAGAAADAPRHGEPWIGRVTSRRRAGEEYPEHVVITPVRAQSGSVRNYVIIARDATQEVAREEQMRRAQRMEGVGQLAGGIAHDFNNMLGAILMQIELVEMDRQVSTAARRELADMRGAVERASNLTRQLLLFSRRQAMHAQPQDLRIIVADMLRILRRLIGERVDVRFERPDVPVPVQGDAGMIEQVVVNLCVNARDAMPEGGELRVSTTLVTLDAGAVHPGRWACLEVADTGVGMTPETQARMFEPFFTTKDVGQGTGLGLATTQGIVAQHGGWIDVESAPGRGSIMRVYLPAIDAVPPTVARPSSPAPRHGAATVLVVEDEAAVRQVVSRTLRRFGHRVIEALSGREALRIWDAEGDAIALVLTDMVMPDGVSGLDLIREVRRTRPDVGAVVMSGYSLKLASQAVPEAVQFVAKPFSIDALGRAVAAALEGQAREDDAAGGGAARPGTPTGRNVLTRI